MDKKRIYIIVCFVTGVLYALIVGEQSIGCRVADGVIYGTVLFLTGNMLWNIFRYAIPSKNHYFILLTLSILVSVFAVGIESFAFYLFFPECFHDFAPSIPVRLFITWLLFIIYRLYYNSCQTIKSIQIESQQPAPTEIIDRITVRSGQKIKIIPVNDVIYFRADGDYVDIYTAEGHWLKEQTMKYTEDILPPDRFVRTHRSYIVNLHHISRIERYGEQQLIILSNGEKIKISNARYQLLKQRLGL